MNTAIARMLRRSILVLRTVIAELYIAPEKTGKIKKGYIYKPDAEF
jgi:hypothetical protein